jgi:hypothetical protein
MHCSNYTPCGREIGLVTYKLSTLGNLRFHSAECRDDYRKEHDKGLQKEARKRHFLDWLRRPPPSP